MPESEAFITKCDPYYQPEWKKMSDSVFEGNITTSTYTWLISNDELEYEGGTPSVHYHEGRRVADYAAFAAQRRAFWGDYESFGHFSHSSSPIIWSPMTVEYRPGSEDTRCVDMSELYGEFELDMLKSFFETRKYQTMVKYEGSNQVRFCAPVSSFNRRPFIKF